MLEVELELKLALEALVLPKMSISEIWLYYSQLQGYFK